MSRGINAVQNINASPTNITTHKRLLNTRALHQEHYIDIDSRIKDVGYLLQQADMKVLALVGMGGISKVNMVSLYKAFGVCFVLYSCIDKGVLKLTKCL